MMDIVCSICNNRKGLMYCSHCLNTSPNIFLALRLRLLALKEENDILKNKVEETLVYATNKANVAKITDETNLENIILSQKLRKIEVIKNKMRNNRIKVRIKQISERIYNRAKHLEQLKKQYLETQDFRKNTKVDENELATAKDKLFHINKVYKNSQSAESKSLIKWFNIKKRDNPYDIQYTISFLPVISLKNFHKLPRSIEILSIRKMFQFLTFYLEILQISSKYDVERILDPMTINDYTKLEENDIVELISILIMLIFKIGRYKKILPQESIDLVWLIDQYDVDTLFYNVVMFEDKIIKCKILSDNAWTFEKILRVVSDTLRLSINYSSTIEAYPKNSGLFDEDKDMWYIVR